MARKSRIHYPGAVYHVILRGNGGQDIFYSKADRYRLYLLLQEGIERYGHRIHAFCLMTNHLHFAIQVGDIPLSKIIQNISFRYTRYINRRKNRMGHLFQGRYKALLIDADSYLLELVRYIHNNPLRAGIVKAPEGYDWSSHRSYLGKETISWLTTDWVLSQFAKHEKRAQHLFQEFCMRGAQEEHRKEFHRGTREGRILGDDRFCEEVINQTGREDKAFPTLKQLAKSICEIYRIDETTLIAPGKQQPGAEARAVAAYFIQDAGKPSLTDLGKYLRRDVSALSRAASRLRDRINKDLDLADKVNMIKEKLV